MPTQTHQNKKYIEKLLFFDLCAWNDFLHIPNMIIIINGKRATIAYMCLISLSRQNNVYPPYEILAENCYPCA